MNQVALAKQAEEHCQLQKAWLIHLRGRIPPVRNTGSSNLGDTTDALVCQGYPAPLPMAQDHCQEWSYSDIPGQALLMFQRTQFTNAFESPPSAILASVCSL